MILDALSLCKNKHTHTSSTMFNAVFIQNCIFSKCSMASKMAFLQEAVLPLR